jgi:hypothetical protein
MDARRGVWMAWYAKGRRLPAHTDARLCPRDVPDASGGLGSESECMTQNPPRRHGALYWTGVTLLWVWNLGLLAMAIFSKHHYNECMADDGYVCMDFTVPIFMAIFAGDALVGLVVALVYRHRNRPAQR